MIRKTSVFTLLAVGLAVAACGAGNDGFVEPTGTRMMNIGAVVGAVDWSKAEARTLTLGEFKFSPSDITFRLNQPYELTLINEGATGHSFAAPGFFEAVAVKGLVFSDGEVAMPILQSVALEAGETKILIFVPVRVAEIPLICDQPLHKSFGMKGEIRIE
ncbi:MAG: hypothetical protein OEZ03_12920 [Alphaproteobacteria bacterium]|nr:hypothetical protein [Alphaproteobacteria bacterium]